MISINKLCPESILKHSVVHFQGIAMKFEKNKIFLSKYVENEISIHKLIPQSVLKHSVVHLQGVAMKFYIN